MFSLLKKWMPTVSVLLVGMMGATSAWGTTATSQALDNVAAYSRTATTPVPPNGKTAAVQVQPEYLAPLYASPKPTTTGFVTCQVTATGSLVCLDGKIVRRWRAPDKAPEVAEDLFTCNNNGLGFDKKQDTCTSLTVDISGAIWIAGKKSSTYSLLKVTETGTSSGCTVGTWLGGETGYPNSSNFCAQEYASGRPYFDDVGSDDGDRISMTIGGVPGYGAGISGVQTRNAIVYFKKTPVPPAEVHVIASSKSILGLSGSEQVQSTALLRLDDGRFFFVYTTSTGKVRVVNAEDNTQVPSTVVFDMLAYRNSHSLPSGCAPTSSDKFGVRVSPTTQQVYISDRASCRILVLNPQSGGIAPYNFVLAMSQDLTLTAAADSTVAMNPETPSVSPGILVNFADHGTSCASPLDCPLLTNSSGATVGLSGVSLVSTDSTMTLFQIKGIPDCRYLTADTRCLTVQNGGTLPNGTVLTRDFCPAGADPNNCGRTDPARQYLNVTPLLPSEVKQAFPTLPAMWISPQYRAQDERGYQFDALLGVTKDGVQFKDTFQMEFETDKLAGGPVRCNPSDNPDIRQWDVVTTVSERVQTFSNGDLNNDDTIVNQFCGGSGTGGQRWSIYSYTLEPTTNTISVVNGVVYLNTDDDALYAKMVDRLYDDLGKTQDTYVCPSSGTQLATTCSTLQSSWANGRDKLTKCIGASTQPKQSSGSQNCQSFLSQLANYQTSLAAVPANIADTANRIGELKTRAQTIYFTFSTRFLPSIPDAGFCEDPTNPACGMTPLTPLN